MNRCPEAFDFVAIAILIIGGVWLIDLAASIMPL